MYRLVSLVLLVSIAGVVVESLNPLGLINTCITDSQCKKHDEFCDHTGLNPIGSCRQGYVNGAKCTFDRHCRSKQCHTRRCVARKPVKDGPCSKDQHDECIETQYCSHKENIYKCRDRSYSGVCSKSEHCLSNRCFLLKCRRPKNITTPSNKIGEMNDASGEAFNNNDNDKLPQANSQELD